MGAFITGGNEWGGVVDVGATATTKLNRTSGWSFPAGEFVVDVLASIDATFMPEFIPSLVPVLEFSVEPVVPLLLLLPVLIEFVAF